MEPPIREHRLSVGGRELAVSELGAPTGPPIIYCHGGLSCRTDIHFAAQAAANAGVRLLAADRPGVGDSDPHKTRTLASWASDVDEVADALQLDRFAVLGWSFGAPYALSCAAHLGSRVRMVGIVGGMTPLNRPDKLEELGTRTGKRLFRWAPTRPWRARGFLYATKLEPHAVLFKQIRSELPDPDVRIFDELGPARATAPFRAALRHSRTGAVQDYQLLATNWDLALDAVQAPVRWWHGALDTFVPVSHARETIPLFSQARLTEVPYFGHYVLRDLSEAIFKELAAGWVTSVR